MRRSIAGVVLGSCLLWSALGWSQSAASADGNVPAARRYFDQGLEHFRTGEFDAAVIDFEAAFRSKPHPSVLFNLGRAYAAAGRPVEAVNALRSYLAEQASVVSAQRRATVEQLIATQEHRLGFVVVRAEPGVAISVDGLAAGEAPLPAAIPVAPGNHALVATRSGFLPAVFSVQIEAAQTRELELKLEALAVASPSVAVATVPEPKTGAPSTRSTAQSTPQTPVRHLDPAGARPRTSHVLRDVGAVSLAVGVASAALGEYFAVSAKDSWHDRNQHCDASGCDDRAVSDWRDAKNNALGADVCFGIGIVAVAAGIYMLVAQPSDAPKPSVAQLSIEPGRDAWLFRLGGHFE
jgi:tetratricopeptide (TPR) repeat protein